MKIMQVIIKMHKIKQKLKRSTKLSTDSKT